MSTMLSRELTVGVVFGQYLNWHWMAKCACMQGVLGGGMLRCFSPRCLMYSRNGVHFVAHPLSCSSSCLYP